MGQIGFHTDQERAYHSVKAQGRAVKARTKELTVITGFFKVMSMIEKVFMTVGGWIACVFIFFYTLFGILMVFLSAWIIWFIAKAVYHDVVYLITNH